MATTSEYLRADLKKAAARHSAPTSTKKKVKRFIVSPADDGSGYHVETDFQEPMGKGGATMYDGPGSDRKTSVHKTLSSVHSHMKDCCESGDS